MKKYTVYRMDGAIDRSLAKHELIAIEYGEDIHRATDDIIRAVVQDLSENPQYTGCEVTAYASELSSSLCAKRYCFIITGVVMPSGAPKNILADYGIMEQEVSDCIQW